LLAAYQYLHQGRLTHLIWWPKINTLTSRLIQAVCKKTAGSHVTLRGNISAPVWVTDLVEVSKDAASLVVCTQKNFGWGCGFFVSDVISGARFGHLCLALSANH